MKINTKEVLKNLAGKDMENEDKSPATIGSVISSMLVTTEAGGKMKVFLLAKKFYEDKEVELDAADLIIVKKAVEDAKGFNNIVIGQLLLKLEA